MKKVIIFASLVIGLAVAAFGQTPTPTPKPAPTPAPYTALKVGDTAPDFTLPDTAGQKVKLSDLRGKSNVVLAFYIFAFTGG